MHFKKKIRHVLVKCAYFLFVLEVVVKEVNEIQIKKWSKTFFFLTLNFESVQTAGTCRIKLWVKCQTYMYLCGDTHAARNVHTEHDQCVLQVLVVIFTLIGPVKFIAVYTWSLTDTHSPHTVAHTVLTPTELTQPYLKRRGQRES